MTLEGLFELTVMFFRLTNSLAIFQTMINEILWDLINIREVASFIDDVIMGTKEKEEHDKVVEKIAKRLVENDLYIKPEKYKVKGVLDWLTPKGVKDIQKFLGLANYY